MIIRNLVICFSGIFLLFSCNSKTENNTVHIYEIQEIVLTAQNSYENPYKEVECWVRLQGPDFDKRVYGFWDGDQSFKVRVAATSPGTWSWESKAIPEDDNGLNGQSGSFSAIPWTDEEKQLNPNRRGFIQSTPNGHALQYADGTPFFFIGDTWWAASTWRYPLTGTAPQESWEPGPEGHSFENMLLYRKMQGYNSLAMIACFPNWHADGLPPKVIDENGIGIRQAWEKFGDGTAKDMHDEAGNLPFEISSKAPMADFDKINPAYFESLDKKMNYIDSIGFVPMLETVRRDHGPSWKTYFEWPNSFTRYIQYIVARYGAYNMIFSPIHLDWIIPTFCLPANDFSEAIIAWHEQYGPLPFGQPVTSLINPATHIIYGTGEQAPWITMHSVGNDPRNNGFFPMLEEQFRITPALPTANLEPYYVGWFSKAGGEEAELYSDRDNYCARSQAWGSVLSGGLSGHIYGTGAYDGTSVGEVEGVRPLIWDALQFPAGKQVGYLRTFIESENGAFQKLELASDCIHPRKSKYSKANSGFDGWSFMMRTSEKNLAMLYFEYKSAIPYLTGFLPMTAYKLSWFDPINGEWLEDFQKIESDAEGVLMLESFPGKESISERDWALKLKVII